MSQPAPATAVTANPDGWASAQEYELQYWREKWPHRNDTVEQLQQQRLQDAYWFLNHMAFTQTAPTQFAGFSGSVLEVGSGPIGFFELMDNVTVTAQDSLMAAYAEHIPFSTLGTRGSTTYIDQSIEDIREKFDFVVCSNVLDHTGDWIHFLAHCRNRVAPGGQLLLFTDSRGAPTPGHTQIFSPPQLLKLIDLLGARRIVVSRAVPVFDQHCDFKNFVRAAF
jgi:2-polyprenyl-3-methyl-5-hydroxy-6-metoxy-1,4-benzoquinol methylase